MHTASQMRANCAITRQEAHYTRPLKKFSLSGLRANQAGAGFSLILKPDEVVVIASQRILRLWQPIHMVPFHPKRGLASAKTYKEKIFFLAADPATHARPTWKVPRVRLRPRCPLFLHRKNWYPRGVTTWTNDYPCPSASRIGERFILGETGAFVFNPTSWGDFPPRPRLLG